MGSMTIRQSEMAQQGVAFLISLTPHFQFFIRTKEIFKKRKRKVMHSYREISKHNGQSISSLRWLKLNGLSLFKIIETGSNHPVVRWLSFVSHSLLICHISGQKGSRASVLSVPNFSIFFIYTPPHACNP